MKRTVTFYGFKSDKISIYLKELYIGQLYMELLEKETNQEAIRQMNEDGINEPIQKYKVTLILEKVNKKQK